MISAGFLLATGSHHISTVMEFSFEPSLLSYKRRTPVFVVSFDLTLCDAVFMKKLPLTSVYCFDSVPTASSPLSSISVSTFIFCLSSFSPSQLTSTWFFFTLSYNFLDFVEQCNSGYSTLGFTTT